MSDSITKQETIRKEWYAKYKEKYTEILEKINEECEKK